MQLNLTNVGMIKEAFIHLDTISLIAGENDTGKSTVGKVLYWIFRNIHNYNLDKSVDFKEFFNRPNINNQIVEDYSIKFNNHSNYLYLNYDKNNKLSIDKNLDDSEQNVIYLDSPDILSKVHFLRYIKEIKCSYNYNFFVTETTKQLIQNLSITQHKQNNISKLISNIISGYVYYDESVNDFFYKKNGYENKFYMFNTSNGVKMFGILQILLNNNTLKNGSVLILDEPDAYLHPKWQIELAKVITELARENIMVLINTHSPYIVDAIKIFSAKKYIKSVKYYLALKNSDNITSNIKDVSEDIEPIFEKLAEPYHILENLELEKIF